MVTASKKHASGVMSHASSFFTHRASPPAKFQIKTLLTALTSKLVFFDLSDLTDPTNLSDDPRRGDAATENSTINSQRVFFKLPFQGVVLA